MINICPICRPEGVVLYGPLATYALCDDCFRVELALREKAGVVLKAVKEENSDA